MSWGKMKDLGAYIKALFGNVETDVTAAGSGDATEVNGAWIDRLEFDSMDVLFNYQALLGQDETLSLALNLQDADDINGTGAADVDTDYLSALSATTVATGDSAGSTEKSAFQVGVDLTMCKRFVRVQWTPDLSASGTDTAKIAMMYLLTGAKYPPANASRQTIRANP